MNTSSSPMLRRKSFVKLSIIASCVLCFLTTNAIGQNTQTTESKADKNIKSSARVNPITLAMEFSLPIGGYPGRGGSTPIELNYSSKVWSASLTSVRTDQGQQSNTDVPYYYLQVSDIATVFGGESIAGWTSSLQPPLILYDFPIFSGSGGAYPRQFQDGESSFDDVGDACWLTRVEERYSFACMGFAWVNVYSCMDPQSQDFVITTVEGSPDCITPLPSPTIDPTPYPTPDQTIYTVDRFHIQMADGSRVEFRKDDKLTNCNVTLNCSPAASGTYLSVDGSGMRFEKAEAQPNLNGEIDDVLYMANGSKYLFPTTIPSGQAPLAKMFIDVNGNTSHYDQTSRTWTDTVGRDIPNDFPSHISGVALGTHDLGVKGINNADITYHVEWKKLKDVFEDSETALHYSGRDACSAIQDNPVSPSLFENAPVDNRTDHHAGNVNIAVTIKQRTCAGFLGDPALFDPPVLASISSPDGKKTEFKYNEYGEITKIIYPTGAWEKFEYGHVDQIGTSVDDVYSQTNRGVKTHSVFDGTHTLVSHYEQFADPTHRGLGIQVTAPDGTIDEKVLFNSTASPYGFEDPRAGMVLEERTKDSNGNLRSRTFNDWDALGPQGTDPYGAAQRDPRLKRTATFLIEPNSDYALVTLSKTEFETPGSGGVPSDPTYFAHLNAKRKKAYNYVSVPKTTAEGSPPAWSTIEGWFTDDNLASVSEVNYSYSADYKSHGIIGLPIRSMSLDPVTLDVNNPLSKTETIYDNALPASVDSYGYSMQSYSIGNSLDCSSNSTPKICWQNPNGPSGSINLSYRAQPTTQRVWYAEGNTWIETHTQYDQFGNAVKKKDPIGNEASTTFNAEFKYAYPVSITAPAPDPNNTGHGTNQTSTVTTSYDFTTGLPLSVTDDFGQVTKIEYDAVLRPYRVKPVVINDSATGPITETTYGQPDSNGQLPASQRFVKVRKQIDANNWDEAITWFDGLGRTIKTQAKDAQGDIFVETRYDQYGRVDRVSNPYRSGDTIYWSRTRYDDAGRAIESYAPATQSEIDYADTHDNSGLTSLGVTSFDISTINNSTGNFIGTVVISKDASGRRSRSITNALGQLIRVDEPTATGGSTADADLGTLAEPAQPTYYKYDVYGKMVQVVQGDQARFFKYDSLGRLLRVKQPEQETNNDLATFGNPNNNSWTAGFAYDISGNVVRATDANGVNIINEYDRANRVVKRCYSKPNVNTSATTCSGIGSGNTSTDTPSVDFWYDGTGLSSQQSPNYAKGRLTKVDNTVSATLYTLFDNFGRLTATEQRTPVEGEDTSNAPARTSTFTYNFSGALVEETYPSGRIVKNEFASDGDLSRVTSKKAGGDVDKPYVSNFWYTASGGISQMRLGNGKWETAGFNRRLQVEHLGLGGGSTDASLWKVDYEYGELEESGSFTASKNSGNIARQTLTVPGASFVQTYKYDELYRLKEAKETPGGSSTANWTQNWTYDRYGNRLAFSQNIGGQTSSYNPTLDSTHNNRFATGQGFTYDKNGNIVNDIDPVTSHTRQFVFNGDNKQIQVKDTSASPNETKGTYYYDGEGKRIK